MKHTKEQLIGAIRQHVAQRSGIDFGNYGSRESFMGEYRHIIREGREARELLRYVELSGITAEDLIAASKSAFSGRLSFVERDDGAVACDYCTGQYFPTEYRAAACAVLAYAVWAYWRGNLSASETAAAPDVKWAQGVKDVGAVLHRKARVTFGRGMASRWFN